MRWSIKLITSGGGKREVELDATSISDAHAQIIESYPGCTITGSDLIPAKITDIRIYDHGQQTTCDRSLIYHPFGEE
jgi:hypothetical protein